MTEESEVTKEQVTTTPTVESLRDEFQAQFKTLKESFESQLSELTKLNESLKSQNTELQRALVRSTVSDPVPQPTPKTPEEQYADQISALAEQTLKRMCKQ